MGFKIMQKFLLAVLAVILTLPSCNAASSSAQLIVGVENHSYYPHYQYSDNQYSGFARELLDEFSRAYAFNPVYKAYTVKGLFKAFQLKQIMLKYPDNPIWSFEGRSGLHIAYSNPVVDYTDGVMTESDRSLNKLSDLKVLGTIEGFTPFPILNLIKQDKIKVIYYPDISELVKALTAKQLDAIYINIDVCNYYLKNVLKKPGSLLFDPTLPFTSGSYYLSTSSHPEVIRKFNTFLYEKRALISELKTKYQLSSVGSLLN
jgi:ABC-type amino acid transport substrate-binding protein